MASPASLLCPTGFHLEPDPGTGGARCLQNNDFSAATIGVNLSQAILNPVDFGEDATRRQTSAAIHEAQLMGARTVRWISDMVWPFYKCSPDLENQLDGSIDPAFEMISQILLEEAQKANIKVVISLFDPILAYGPSYGASKPTIYSNSGEWIWGRYSGWIAGSGGYDYGGYDIKKYSAYSGSACVNQGQSPLRPFDYYGSTSFGPQTGQNSLIENDLALKKLSTRFWNQTVILNQLNSQYHSLGAVTLFNEPYNTGTQTAKFGTFVTSVMSTLIQYFPTVSFSAGIAWWEPQTVVAGAGYLGLNNYIGQHRYYPSPSNWGSSVSQNITLSAAILADLFGFKNGIFPWFGNGFAKPFVYEEFGAAGLMISSSSDVWNLINAGYGFHESNPSANGLWFWTRDDWQDGSGQSHEDIISPQGNDGDAFRDRFINIAKEASFYPVRTFTASVLSGSSWVSQARQIQVGRETADSGGHLGVFGVSLALDSTAARHWFRGTVRDGVFRISDAKMNVAPVSRGQEQRISVSNTFVKSHALYASENPGWIEIVQLNSTQYQLNDWECSVTNQAGFSATPAYVQDQLLSDGWGVLPNTFWLADPICPFSKLMMSGQL